LFVRFNDVLTRSAGLCFLASPDASKRSPARWQRPYKLLQRDDRYTTRRISLRLPIARRPEAYSRNDRMTLAARASLCASYVASCRPQLQSVEKPDDRFRGIGVWFVVSQPTMPHSEIKAWYGRLFDSLTIPFGMKRLAWTPNPKPTLLFSTKRVINDLMEHLFDFSRASPGSRLWRQRCRASERNRMGIAYPPACEASNEISASVGL